MRVDIRDVEGLTPLSWAITNRQEIVLGLLLNRLGLNYGRHIRQIVLRGARIEGSKGRNKPVGTRTIAGFGRGTPTTEFKVTPQAIKMRAKADATSGRHASLPTTPPKEVTSCEPAI